MGINNNTIYNNNTTTTQSTPKQHSQGLLYALPIKEEDKPLTAFVTHRSKYEFNYLPFGINCGPSYMCRLMDAALQGLAWETCMPYLDDCGVWSTGVGQTLAEREADSFEKMLSNLHAVFERLKWAGLSMKSSKCELFTTRTRRAARRCGTPSGSR